jgi:hypothetical protein
MKHKYLVFIFTLLIGCTVSNPKFFEKVNQSSDKTYGYTAANPIKIKNGNISQSINATYYYLSQLRTEKGEKLRLIRRFSVKNPAFKDSKVQNRYSGQSISGKGPMLDLYLLKPENSNDTLEIYINSYERDEVKLPAGLMFKEK